MATGTVVQLEGDGLVNVFRIVAKNGTTAHWATSNLEMNELDRLRLADASWRIEEYHRGLKQVTNAERCQVARELPSAATSARHCERFWCSRSGLFTPAPTGSPPSGTSPEKPSEPTEQTHATDKHPPPLRNS